MDTQVAGPSGLFTLGEINSNTQTFLIKINITQLMDLKLDFN